MPLKERFQMGLIRFLDEEEFVIWNPIFLLFEVNYFF